MVRFILEKLHLNGDVAKHIVGAYITFAETSGYYYGRLHK